MPKELNFTGKEFRKYAKRRGISEPHKMSIAANKNAPHIQEIKRKSHSIRRKINRLNLKKIGKKPNVLKRDLREATELLNMSLDDLKKIAILQRIKNYNDLSKEDLIYALLRSESDPTENNYMEYINNNTNDKKS